MKWYGVLAGLLFLPAAGLSAAPPFVIDGLHVHQGFEEAVSRAEALGGVCELGSLRRGEVVTALCEFRACGDEGACPEATDPPPIAVVAQPVLRIGLEAPADARGLTRIAFIFEGDSQVVKAALLERFGPPDSDAANNTEKSWSHARRVQWRSGSDAMGLLMRDKVITLTRDAPPPAGDAAATPGAGGQKQPGGS
jgi:hypothetical protein